MSFIFNSHSLQTILFKPPGFDLQLLPIFLALLDMILKMIVDNTPWLSVSQLSHHQINHSTHLNVPNVSITRFLHFLASFLRIRLCLTERCHQQLHDILYTLEIGFSLTFYLFFSFLELRQQDASSLYLELVIQQCRRLPHRA
jgi:hypothetical protein